MSLDSSESSVVSVDTGSEQAEHKNKKEISEIGQCQIDIDCLLEERNDVPNEESIMKLSDNGLVELCRKYSNKELLLTAESIDIDKNWIINTDEASLLKELVLKSIDKNINEKLLKDEVRIDQMEKNGASRESINIALATLNNLYNDFHMAKTWKGEQQLLAMKEMFQNPETKLASNEEMPSRFTLEVRATVLEKVLDIVSTLNPISSAEAKWLRTFNDIIREFREQLQLWVDITPEFLENFEAIKEDFLSSLYEHQENLRKRWKEFFTTTQDRFLAFNDFFQQINLLLYSVGLASWPDSYIAKYERKYWELKKKNKMAYWTTDLTHEIEVYAIIKVSFDRIRRWEAVDTGENFDKLEKRFGVVNKKGSEIKGTPYKKLTPWDDAVTLLRRAPALKSVINERFLSQTMKMQKEMDDLATELFDSKELSLNIRKSIEQNKAFGRVLKAFRESGNK